MLKVELDNIFSSLYDNSSESWVIFINLNYNVLVVIINKSVNILRGVNYKLPYQYYWKPLST